MTEEKGMGRITVNRVRYLENEFWDDIPAAIVIEATEKIPEDKFQAIKQAVERILNRETKIKKKQKNREAKERLEYEQFKKDHPDYCFCDNQDVDTERDTPIEFGGVYFSPYDHNKTNPIRDPIFKCKSCGKKVHFLIAFA